jgi:hypothetical protein
LGTQPHKLASPPYFGMPEASTTNWLACFWNATRMHTCTQNLALLHTVLLLSVFQCACSSASNNWVFFFTVLSSILALNFLVVANATTLEETAHPGEHIACCQTEVNTGTHGWLSKAGRTSKPDQDGTTTRRGSLLVVETWSAREMITRALKWKFIASMQNGISTTNVVQLQQVASVLCFVIILSKHTKVHPKLKHWCCRWDHILLLRFIPKEGVALKQVICYSNATLHYLSHN